MALFVRLLQDKDKASGLNEAVGALRSGDSDPRLFKVDPEKFPQVPGAPFAYWVAEGVRRTFRDLVAFETEGRTAKRGPSTCDDSRYLRCWWEVKTQQPHGRGEWRGFAKGGTFSRFFADIHLVVDWEPARSTFLGFFGRPGREISKPESDG